MTEKRFKLKYINEQHLSANLFDDKTFIGSIGIGAELIVELLNDLSEENELLKQYVQSSKKFTKKVEDFFEKCGFDTVNFRVLEDLIDVDNFIYEKYLKLEKENERLKSELISKDDLIQQLKIKLNMDYYNEWKKCNLKYTEICEELLEEDKLYKKLSDENEQLKQSNQKLNDELQETMGYLALKSGVEKENEQLKKDNKLLMDKMFEMRTNNALDRTEISKQHYSVNEFLEDLEKW